MAASDNLSENQFSHLPETMTANQMYGGVSLEDHEDLFGRFDEAGGDDRKLLNMKYKNAKQSGLLDDVLQNGVKQPLEVHVDKDGWQTLTEGHHRLSIALKHFPDHPLPIKYWNG